MATEHFGNPLKDVIEDCFVSEAISYEGEESDNNDADDDEMTTDWIDERTNELNGGSSSASSSSSGVVTEFLPLEKAKSIVWNYFGFPARSGKFVQKDKRLRKEVYCKVCQRPLSYKGNMTNMIVHLQSHHSAVYSEIADQLKCGSAHSSLASLPKDQLSIRDSFKKLTPLPRSSSRWKALTNSVCYFLAKDLHPLSTVNDKGFLHMLKEFEPRYSPPDRTTITRHYLPELYAKEKEKICKPISGGLQWYAVTCDGWSSRANHSYLSLTLHYINNKWELKYFLLETGEIVEQDTAINLASYLEEVLARWNLPITQISAVVTDNASNITAAIAIFKRQRVGCFSHTLQLSVQKALNLPVMSRAIARGKRLVGHFHSSVKSTNVLQRDLKHAEHKLIQVNLKLEYDNENTLYIVYIGCNYQVEFHFLYAGAYSTATTAIMCYIDRNSPI